MANYLATDTDLTAVANAIRTKGGTSAQLEFPDEFVSAIQNIPSGGDPNPTAEDNDVIFIDYDGTIRYSYTKAQFLALTELPENPVQEGLTAQGWNWTLADAKEYVTEYYRLTIGQNYVTDDGKTRLYVWIDKWRKDFVVTFTQTVTNGVLVDFGDETTPQRYSGTGAITSAEHTYAESGNYIITLLPDEGCTMRLGAGSSSWGVCWPGSELGNSHMAKRLKRIEIGVRCDGAGGYSCRYAWLEYMSVPKEATFFWASTFQGSNLRAFVIPPGCTTLYGNGFADSNRMERISLPKGFDNFAGTFTGNSSLRRIEIPDETTTISGSALRGLESVEYLIIPKNITTLDGHRNLSNCRGLKEVHFRPATPPTMTQPTNFENVPTDCIIYVPTGKLNDYKTATNYPDPSVYTYMEE